MPSVLRVEEKPLGAQLHHCAIQPNHASTLHVKPDEILNLICKVPSHVPPRYVCALQACKLAELQMAAYGVFAMPHLCSFNSQSIGWKPSRRTITSFGKRYRCSITEFIGSSCRCSHDRPGNRACSWFNGPFISRHVWDIDMHIAIGCLPQCALLRMSIYIIPPPSPKMLGFRSYQKAYLDLFQRFRIAL